ncbi:MAG: hypothetical protein NTV34_15050, partial [Proteobacteria bacterium]|nr:hypothetical protein [Pseudomonadota bacterium]
MSTSPILLGLLLSLYLAPQPNISALGQSNQGSGGNLVEGLEAGSTPVSNKVERAKALDIKPKEVIHWTPQGAESNVETGDVLLLMQLTTDQQFTIYQKNLQWHPPTGWSVSHVDAP